MELRIVTIAISMFWTIIVLACIDSALGKGGRGGGGRGGGSRGGSSRSGGSSGGSSRSGGGSSKGGWGGGLSRSVPHTRTSVRSYVPGRSVPYRSNSNFGSFAQGAAVGYLIGGVHRPYYIPYHGYRYNSAYLREACEVTVSTSEINLLNKTVSLTNNTANANGTSTTSTKTTVKAYFQCDRNERCCGKDCCYDETYTTNQISGGGIALIVFVILVPILCIICCLMAAKNKKKKKEAEEAGQINNQFNEDGGVPPPGYSSYPPNTVVSYPPNNTAVAYSNGDGVTLANGGDKFGSYPTAPNPAAGNYWQPPPSNGTNGAADLPPPYPANPTGNVGTPASAPGWAVH